ncbi:MAG: 4-hydroxy-tetrahydrodipicolinate reductase [Pseudomonadota bacterium]
MNIVIQGAAGRMGCMLIRHVLAAQDMVLAGATDRPDASSIGQDAATLAGLTEPCGVVVGDDLHDSLATAHALIDFSSPASTVAASALAAQAKAVHVIGTTGLSNEDAGHLERAARHTPVVWADNMSLGVTLLSALVEQTAARLGESFDIEIVEMHHRHKVDAPSGTALALGRSAAKGRGVALDDVAARGRDGITGARRDGDIGFAALRGGEVIGDHTAIFAGAGERLELSHKASSRDIYAHGALTALRWAVGKPPGLYSMRDVLNL